MTRRASAELVMCIGTKQIADTASGQTSTVADRPGTRFMMYQAHGEIVLSYVPDVAVVGYSHGFIHLNRRQNIAPFSTCIGAFLM